MDTKSHFTCFAPAERSTPEEIQTQSKYFLSDDFFVQLLNFVPIFILILNQNRQLVFCNSSFLSLLSLSSFDSILGKRPGEILNCRHTKDGAGCGTTKFCKHCGAVNAILTSQQSGCCISECRMLALIAGNEEAFDFRVWTNQLDFNRESFTFFTVVNIEDEKRRLFLERIFLHDISNTANSILGFSTLANREELDALEKANFIRRLTYLSKTIVEEIKAHRQLIAAEYNKLELTLEKIDTIKFIDELQTILSNPETLNGRSLKINEQAESLTFQTDKTLLRRVLGNMIKNALEASAPGETVTVGCCFKNDSHISFWVHNPTYIPENIRLQMFNRSFSTKGVGRGLGTYSMKYFTEKYMNGSISFKSNEPEGTTFTVTYPVALQ